MKEILLLGDSIRIYTQEKVSELLGENYHVSAPSDNCRFSTYTLNMLRWWLPQFPKPDIIHWNNGLWDTVIAYQEDGCFTSLELYEENLYKIIRELKKTGAQIVFSTTTPVAPEKENPPKGLFAHYNADIERYNERSKEVMKKENVFVNDLYALVKPQVEVCIRKDDLIHPTETGIDLIAHAIVNAIYQVEKNK